MLILKIKQKEVIAMIRFIDEYRKSPKRIVLTLKFKKSLYLLKQGQLSSENYSDKTIVEKKDYNSCDNVLETNIGGFVTECLVEDTCAHAFKPYENVCCTDGDFVDCGAESFKENRACIKDYELQNDGNRIRKDCNKPKNERKFYDKSTKGAYVCEKTYRVLLCDVIAVFGASWAIICLVKEILKKKYKD